MARNGVEDHTYNDNSPLRNEMDRRGGEPGIGLVVGVARWTFCLIELAIGVVARVIKFVLESGSLFCRLELTPGWWEENKPNQIFSKGAHDFWIGLKEIVTLGFHEKIDRTLSQHE